jgi:hypothetical protein
VRVKVILAVVVAVLAVTGLVDGGAAVIAWRTLLVLDALARRLP